MPTGYTAKIADGTTFNDFVMACARGMGALIMMRDEPSNAPIPERFEPSDYHATKQVAAEMELGRLLRMAPEEAEQATRTEFMEESARHFETMQKNDDLRQKYEAMLAEVKAWQPPTPDHEGVKKFMAEQITGSIDFDCDNGYYRDNAPKRLNGPEWLEKKIAAARHDIDHHRKNHSEEVERTESRNRWLKSLRDSLKSGDSL